MAKLNHERAATILVEAAYSGDVATVQKFGITRQTLHNYRKRLDEDSELLLLFTNKKRQYETDWANEIPSAIRAAVRFLQRASNEANPKDPDTIHAVAGALKILAEVGITKAILDVRLSGFLGANGAEDTAVDSPKQLPATN